MYEKNSKEKISEKENKKEFEKFPCNRPRHRKGKVPTKGQLNVRRLRDGD